MGWNVALMISDDSKQNSIKAKVSKFQGIVSREFCWCLAIYLFNGYD